MPIYIYSAKDEDKGCDYCRGSFECKQHIKDEPLTECPQCHSPVKKVFTPFMIGPGKGDLDRQAKEHGFHKLKKVDKGKYEKLY